MVCLFAEVRHHLPQLRAALADATIAGSWEELSALASEAACSVIRIDVLGGSSGRGHLAALKERLPEHPLILVTRWELENARQLAGIVVEEVVWVQEIGEALAAVVERTCSGRPNVVHCLGIAFQESGHLPGALRMALSRACRSERSMHSVAELAAAVGCDRRTLWQQWSQVVGPSSEFRLQDFLHWLALHRAMGLKRPDRSWDQVADAVGVHPHTLGRWAQRYTGGTLRELAATGPQAAITTLHERWTPLVLGKLGVTLGVGRG